MNLELSTVLFSRQARVTKVGSSVELGELLEASAREIQTQIEVVLKPQDEIHFYPAKLRVVSYWL